MITYGLIVTIQRQPEERWSRVTKNAENAASAGPWTPPTATRPTGTDDRDDYANAGYREPSKTRGAGPRGRESPHEEAHPRAPLGDRPPGSLGSVRRRPPHRDLLMPVQLEGSAGVRTTSCQARRDPHGPIPPASWRYGTPHPHGTGGTTAPQAPGLPRNR